jgi:outer membrane receptor protein involved in Fe transport
MVVTADKTPQSQGNVTQKIDVLDQGQLDATVSPNRNIAEAVGQTPGASVSVLSRNDANWGTYGGIGPKYSTFMLNGLPIDAFVDPMSLDLNAVEQIEVQRGPASVLYPNYLSQDFAGNQSPLAGTVNLVLKSHIDTCATILRSSFGSYNTLNSQAYHQYHSGPLNVFCGASYEKSDYTDYGIANSWLNMQDNPEYTKSKVYGGATLLLGAKETHAVRVFGQKTWHDGDAGRPYRGFDHDYGTLNIGYDVGLSERVKLQSNLGIRTYQRSWQESAFGVIDTLKSNNGVNQRIVPADISVSFTHGKNHLLIIGADYQSGSYDTWSDPLTGYALFGNKSRALQGGGYAQEELRFGGLTLRGGFRLAYVNNVIDFLGGAAPGQKRQSWTKPLWSAGARYQLMPQLAVYANGGSSFMAPGLKSIGGTIGLAERGVSGHNGQLPNPDLKPESGVGADLGVDCRLALGLRGGLRGFVTKVNDAIIDNVVSSNPSQTQSINAGASTATGAEIELSQQLIPAVSWFVNYTYMHTEIENELDADQNGSQVPFSPEHVANLGIDFTAPFGLRVRPALNYTGGYFDGSSLSGRKEFTPGVVLNAYVSQQLFTNDRVAIDCFGQFHNITNNDYEMPWQFKDPGFSAQGGVGVRF